MSNRSLAIYYFIFMPAMLMLLPHYLYTTNFGSFKRCITYALFLIAASVFFEVVSSFSLPFVIRHSSLSPPTCPTRRNQSEFTTRLFASPKRLEENASGILYVNEKCINCAACSYFAPTVFERNSKINKHVVYNQPSIDDENEVEAARAALAVCPVAAIRVENDMHTDANRKMKRALAIQPTTESAKPFPRSIFPMETQTGDAVNFGVHFLGHHNDASFGAFPYLATGKSPDGGDISIMVDVPRFGPSAVKAVKSLTENGPDYLFLTHVDDTADHNKWKSEFPDLKRIFHSGDLGSHNWIGDLTLEHVEILLNGETKSGQGDNFMVWDINGNQQSFDKIGEMKEGEFLILHTPGHSPGSISLLFRPEHQATMQSKALQSSTGDKVKYPRGVLFTGDTYAWTTRDGGHMSGFPRYGNNLQQQASILSKLGDIALIFDIIASGHGHPRFYLGSENSGKSSEDDRKLEEMEDALKELKSYH